MGEETTIREYEEEVPLTHPGLNPLTLLKDDTPTQPPLRIPTLVLGSYLDGKVVHRAAFDGCPSGGEGRADTPRPRRAFFPLTEICVYRICASREDSKYGR